MWLRAYLEVAILGGIAVCAPALLRQRADPGSPEEVGILEALGAQNLTYFWAGRGRSTYSPQRETKPGLGKRPWWVWRSPWGKYGSSPTGLAIDARRNIYLTELNSIRKFSPNGVESWSYPRRFNEEFNNAPSLLDGRVFTSSTGGRVVALSMESGRELWSTKALKGKAADGTNGFVSAQEGVVLTRAGTTASIRGRKSCCGDAGTHVVGLNATTGSVLWSFEPEVPIWNFLASFVGDGTFVFQDLEGRAYRARLNDGSIIWRSGGVNGTWTDGSAMLGPNNLVYAVNTHAYGSAGPDGTGALSAYDLRDGNLVWRRKTLRPPNNVPAIGHVSGYPGLTVVQPVGQQCLPGAPTDVHAYDAATGGLRWSFRGPAQNQALQAGELEGAVGRVVTGVRPITQPNPWSPPSIADGVVYIGNEMGNFYALADMDQDGRVQGDDEVKSYDTKACFSGSAAPAIAPGMVAAASIDALYVFKTP